MAAVSNQSNVLSYNGISFGAFTETVGFTVRPEYDTAGRSVKWHNYSLTFRSYSTGAASASAMRNLRSALNKPGGVFIYRGRGTGDIVVNTGGVRDVKNGPLPREISYKMLGGDAVELVWGLDFAIPDCPDARYIGAPAEFTYTVDISLDPKGYTTRTISGRLAIPQNQATPGSRTIQDNADAYWERCVPALQPEFRRTFGPRNLSADRSEITWSVVDEELQGPAPPPGVFDHDGSTTFNSDNGLGSNWNGSISYTAELTKDGSIDSAIRGMEDFILWRLFKMGQMKHIGENGQKKPAQVVPLSWVIREPSAFKDKTIEVTMSFLVAAEWSDVLRKSGMWTLTPGAGNWGAWAQSLSNSAFNPRGFAKLRFNNADDRLVDLCGGQIATVQSQAIPKELRNDPNRIVNLFPPVNPNNSWLYFRNELRADQDSGTVVTRTLPMSPLDGSTDRVGTLNAANPNFGGGNAVQGGGVGNNQLPNGLMFIPGRLENNGQSGETTATRTARPLQFVFMEGSAARVGFKIPEPELTEVNGVKVIPMNRPDMGENFRQKVVWNNGRDAVYVAKWKFRYALERDLPTGPLPTLPNPLMDNK